MTQEILLNNSPTTGTTIVVFDTVMSDTTAFDSVYNSFLIFDQNNKPSNIFNYNGDVLYIRTGNYNNFVPLNEVTDNYITGYTGIINTDRLMKESEKNRYIDRYNSKALLANPETKTFFFFEDKPTDDMFVNINLNRTFDTLNTLSVYNNLLNSFPIQECGTGVVFGKLEAIQKVKNQETGKNYRIPLSDVPIGIFNPSVSFPQSTSTDENGNRIKLNFEPLIQESLDNSRYFNQQSLDFDKQFLQSPDGFTSIPDQYKFVTKTNSNGEFIIYDVPTGSQVLIFDIDLLKQGLTKEEVALNFFPYPAEESPNIDSVPHYFFRQIPIDVVPAWGDIQTGYTEVNVSVNLDLRKWATYFVTPISFNNKNLDVIYSEGLLTNPLTVAVRDMTKSDFSMDITIQNPELPFLPINSSEIVEIPNLLNRDTSQEIQWFNEFPQVKKTADFRSKDFNALKLPANIYSPFIINSNEKDKTIPKIKGTWFCGYQLNMYFLNNGFFRSTGLERDEINNTTKSHYFLNKTATNTDENRSSIGVGVKNKEFPYEKPWSDTYPEQVKIPKQPIDINPAWVTAVGTKQNPVSNPKFKDGDMVGLKDELGVEANTSEDGGGYGLQFNSDISKYFTNIFSRRVNSGFLFKYEAGVSLNERYANGYQPNLDGSHTSSVINGEKYQRIEAGFEYFLKPDAWPDVNSFKNFDALNSTNKFIYKGEYERGVYVDPTKNMYLKTDADSILLEGGLDLYRIVDPLDLANQEPAVIPTKAFFNLHSIYRKKASDSTVDLFRPDNSNREGSRQSLSYPLGVHPSSNFYFENYSFKIFNRGTADAEIGGIKISPGQSYNAFVGLNYVPGPIELPGNAGFDTNTFSFTQCKYDFEFYDFGQGSGNADQLVGATSYVSATNAATTDGIHYNLVSEYVHDVKRASCNRRGKATGMESGNGKLYGIILGADGNSELGRRYFTTQALNFNGCTNDTFTNFASVYRSLDIEQF